ncbi:VOC family protein [Leifsonia sp. McL0607]|uniref:VOC family protein n=1 Tax=Leifsonia sp. McL0607 TaxID=3415672 RepID=UPI003CEC10DE
MITGLHAIVYSDDPEATRAFFREVLVWPFIEARPGWPIFDTGASETAAHPRTWEGSDQPYAQRHELSLLCDDLDATMEELRTRGATFAGEVDERPYGRCVFLEVPGLEPMLMYQPLYSPAWEGPGGITLP